MSILSSISAFLTYSFFPFIHLLPSYHLLDTQTPPTPKQKTLPLTVKTQDTKSASEFYEEKVKDLGANIAELEVIVQNKANTLRVVEEGKCLDKGNTLPSARFHKTTYQDMHTNSPFFFFSPTPKGTGS